VGGIETPSRYGIARGDERRLESFLFFWGDFKDGESKTQTTNKRVP
jgi:hypothetical protein